MKTERLYLRVLPQQKKLFADKAESEGLSLSEWIFKTLGVECDIQIHEKIYTPPLPKNPVRTKKPFVCRLKKK